MDKIRDKSKSDKSNYDKIKTYTKYNIELSTKRLEKFKASKPNLYRMQNRRLKSKSRSRNNYERIKPTTEYKIEYSKIPWIG